MSLSSLQTASQLHSIGSGQVDIKYEDYPFTPTSMASQHSWCALSQAWAASTRPGLAYWHHTAHFGFIMEAISPSWNFSSWRNCSAETLNWGLCSIWWLHVFWLTWPDFIYWDTLGLSTQLTGTIAEQGHRVPGLQFYKRMSISTAHRLDSSARAKNTVEPGLNTDPGSLELTPNKPHLLSGTTRTTYFKEKSLFLEKRYTKYTNAKTMKWKVKRHGYINPFFIADNWY